MSDMSNVFILDHPLIQHKISRLRDENTGTNEFRKLIEEIAMLMGYEALRDLPMEDVEIKTPIETCKTPMIAGKKMAIVPILRAGLGMVGGILALVPSAKVGHIGLYRDPETHEPHEYYCKLPEPIDQRTIVVLDPMLATGGSGSEAVDFIKQHGGKNIRKALRDFARIIRISRFMSDTLTVVSMTTLTSVPVSVMPATVSSERSKQRNKIGIP